MQKDISTSRCRATASWASRPYNKYVCMYVPYHPADISTRPPPGGQPRALNNIRIRDSRPGDLAFAPCNGLPEQHHKDKISACPEVRLFFSHTRTPRPPLRPIRRTRASVSTLQRQPSRLSSAHRSPPPNIPTTTYGTAPLLASLWLPPHALITSLPTYPGAVLTTTPSRLHAVSQS